jgi:VWFA-related protein
VAWACLLELSMKTAKLCPRMGFGIFSGLSLALFLSSLFLAPSLFGQGTNTSAASGGTAEVSADKPSTLKVRVNVVEVHVVVRDSKGNAVPGLTQEDFRLFDNGKRQAISNFAEETAATRIAAAVPNVELRPEAKAGATTTENAALPGRFVAMLFDDTHLAPDDLQITKKAASSFLDGLGPGDRVGFYSTSGQFTHEFSGDKEELKKALAGLMAHERLANPEHDCPKVSYFMAKKVNLFNDATAFQIIVNNALRCAYAGDPLMMRQAESLAKSAIVQEMPLGQADNSFVYDRVQAVLQRLAGMPGERAMVLVSPGFSLSVDSSRLWRIVDQANRSKIMINTLDARGLYTAAMYHGSSSDMPTPEAMNYQQADGDHRHF